VASRRSAKIGYARVSTRSQNDDSQIDDLAAYGCDKILTDKASRKLAARPTCRALPATTPAPARPRRRQRAAVLTLPGRQAYQGTASSPGGGRRRGA